MLFYYFSLKLHIKMLALKLYSVSWEKTLLIKILCGICYDFFMHCNNGVFSLFDRMSELHVQVKHNITLPYFHCTHLTAMYKYTHEDTHISSHHPPPHPSQEKPLQVQVETYLSVDVVLVDSLLLSFPVHLLVNAIVALAPLAFLQKEFASVLLEAQPAAQDLHTYRAEFGPTWWSIVSLMKEEIEILKEALTKGKYSNNNSTS